MVTQMNLEDYFRRLHKLAEKLENKKNKDFHKKTDGFYDGN